MTPKSFKSAILGILILVPSMAIIYFIFNLLIKSICIAMLFLMTNPLTSLIILAGIALTWYLIEKLLVTYNNQNK